MHCEIDSRSLNSELDFLGPVLKDRPVQPPVIRCLVAGGELEMSAFDGHTNLSTKAPVTSATDGVVCVSPKVFRPMARLLPKGLATIAGATERDMALSWTGGEARFPMSKQWLLKPPTGPSAVDLTLPGQTLFEMLKIVSFSVDAAARYRIPGVLLEVSSQQLTMAATDGYSLAVVERAVEQQAAATVILPYAALDSINGLLEGANDVRLLVTDDYITVTSGTRSLTTRAAIGTFPAYRRMIPAAGKTAAIFHASDMAAAIHRVNLSSLDNPFGQVTLTFTTDTIDVKSDECHETLTCNYAGAPYVVTFDMKKLRALLTSTKCQRITLFTDNPVGTQLFHPDGPGGVQLILVPIHKR